MITELTIPNRDATISNCTQPDKDACSAVVATSTVVLAAFGCQLCFIFDGIPGRLYVFWFECCLACVRCHAALAQPVIHQLFFGCFVLTDM